MMYLGPRLSTTIKYPDQYDELEVITWCSKNCPGGFYLGRDWENWASNELNRTIQFVDERDALLFILKFL